MKIKHPDNEQKMVNNSCQVLQLPMKMVKKSAGREYKETLPKNPFCPAFYRPQEDFGRAYKESLHKFQ